MVDGLLFQVTHIMYLARIRFGIFLPKKAVLAETNYSPFLFLLGSIYGQNKSEINFST